MYKLNKTGPNTDPWGTPNLMITVSEVILPNLMHWDLPFKKLVNHARAVPFTPISYLRIFKRTSWSTVSKAALRSKSITTVALFSSDAMSKSFVSLTKRVSVLWCFLYANCSSQLRLL